MSLINSGDPTRNEAVVRSGMLFGASKAVDWRAALAALGQSYTVSTITAAGAKSLTVTNTGGYLFVLKNDSSSKQTLVLTDLTIHSNTAGIVWWFTRGVTLGALVNHHAKTCYNVLTGASDTPISYVFGWDEVADGITGITGGADIMAGRTAIGPNEIGVSSCPVAILPEGTAIALSAIGASEQSIVARFSMVDKSLVDLLKL